jgi:hypothetical protein
MADDKTKKTGGLLDQYNLLGAIIDSPWATRLDHKVARHVIDRYYPKHGNGRASLRYLEQATGSSRSNITTSIRRLAENGAIIITRQGQGTRPTEYALNFEFPASGTVDVTSSDDVPSVPVGVTSSGHVDSTSSASSVPVGVTESYLHYPAYKPDILIDRDDTRPPSASPLAGGLAAPAAGESAVEESAPEPTFEALWRAYGHAKDKKKASAAWKELPAEIDRAEVIEAAAAWQASWAAQGKPNAPRFTLARWLADERYDEDAPAGFQKVEKASKAKPSSPERSGRATIPAKASHAFAEGETLLTIVKADVVKGAASATLDILASDEDGMEYVHKVVIESHDYEVKPMGNERRTKLSKLPANISGLKIPPS